MMWNWHCPCSIERIRILPVSPWKKLVTSWVLLSCHSWWQIINWPLKKKGATWFWWILFIWSCSSLTTYSRILSCNYMDEAISCFVKLPSKIHDIFFNGGKCCYMIMNMVIIYALACPYIGRQEMRLVPIPIQYIFLA